MSVKNYINQTLSHYEPYKIFLGGASLVALAWVSSHFLSSDKDFREIANDIFGFLIKKARALPVLSSKVREECQKISAKVEDKVRETDTNPLYELPDEPIDPSELIAKMEALRDAEEFHWRQGFVSGAVYSGDDNLKEITTKAYGLFVHCNPLHLDIFPSMRKFEAEVVRFTKRMLSGGDGVCGVMTAGGTESLLMTVKAYRDYAKEKRGITRPELIIPLSCHAAFDKAACYFNVKLIKIPLNSDMKVDLKQLKSKITSNTIAIVGSAPGFPHGVIDDIQSLSAIALEHNIPLHVDSCLGGFILPWARELGYPIPPFDFSLPGVTSMSCDTHKYGFAPKGSSVLLFKNLEYRHYLYFVATDWPGGIYPSPGLPGSRPGGLIAACWAALLSTGKKGYREATIRIMQSQKKIKEGLKNMQDVVLIGDSQTPVIAWTTTRVGIYSVADYMNKKGWHLNSLHKPSCMHICLTLRHCGREEAFLNDLAESIQEAKNNPNLKDGSAPIYGMMATIPDRSLVKEMVWSYMDALLDS
eukprot:TRINITY_DN2288_c0_g2_i3.p1 TRINITY_DN2288_c0_g2~~TRINITY_DN2288_c0_g2_i3.p1  ORF type:complete len:529 (-),score=99.80 TRINITY_DN2288_c0_g2_i3:23-1609(-)